MEKNQRRSLIIIAVLFVGIVCAIGQYMGAFNAMYVLATDPNPGHSWNQMECSTGLCVDTVNNRVGVGTTSPQTNLHVVGGFKVGAHTTCDSSTGAWSFTTPVSVSEPTASNHAATKNYVDSCVKEIICPSNVEDPRDGNIYSTALIGNICWFAENMAYLPEVVGKGTVSTSDPLYYVYGYDGTSVATAKATANYSNYGVLYNWPAATTACPPGWRLPSDTEQHILEKYYATGTCDPDRNNAWDCAPAGLSLKTGDFSAVGSGYMKSSNFYSLGVNHAFWSSTEASTDNYFRERQVDVTDTTYKTVYRTYSLANSALSVRCVKN